MIKVIGVKFRCSGKMYFFDPTDIEFKRGDKVIVETARGRELGNVCAPNREVADDEVVQPLKPIMRRATEADLKSAEEYKAKEPDAFKRCKEKIREHGLEMKLVETEYTFDGSKVIFYFTADGRVDFRELVKDLASMFRTRIELRQIGVRDEAVIRGGLGACGRTLCCSSYLNDFVPVSIKMAKEQNLSLNPTKISGVCGRLMCCLKNEQETYEYLNSTLPNVGEEVVVKFEGIKGKVTSVSVLRQRIKVMTTNEEGENEINEYDVSELSFKGAKREFDDAVDDAELAALLDKEEEKAEDDRSEVEAERVGHERKNRDGQGGRGKGNRERGEHQDRNNSERKNQDGQGELSENSERQERNNRAENGEKTERKNHRNGDRKNRDTQSVNRDNRERKNRDNQGERNENGEKTERKNNGYHKRYYKNSRRNNGENNAKQHSEG